MKSMHVKTTDIAQICAVAAAAIVIGASALAADTDCGAIVTTGNIADTAKVENHAGANAGKATVTINDNSGTAHSVTVYNAATIDTALAGKASTGDLSAHIGDKGNPHGVTAEQVGALPIADKVGNSYYVTNSIVIPELQGFPSGGISVFSPYQITFLGGDGISLYDWVEGEISSSTNSLWTAIPSWARASSKPSYNFSEIGSKPTTLAGYGITDAALAETAKTSGGTSGKSLSLTVGTVSRPLGEYYISIGADGKPHLMLRK